MKQTKKILAILLSALMLLSVMTVGISANTDAPIVIDEASDWKQYVAAGGFPENANVTVTAQLEEPLSSNFNGNGATVTTSVPLFYNIAGTTTVENLTINGKITDAGVQNAAALSEYTTGIVTIKNVVNNADVAFEDLHFANTGEGVGVGGVLGNTSGGTTKMIDCINNGNVTVNNGTNIFVGGIIGKVRNSVVSITNCVNNGEIVANSKDNKTVGAGGIVGYVYGGGAWPAIKGCVNTCNVTSTNISGGILGAYGRTWGSVIEYCYNKGEIKATGANGQAGGIDGYGYHAKLNYCWNSGNVVGTLYSGQISVFNPSQDYTNNYYLSTLDAKAFHFKDAEATNEGATPFTADDLASGKLAYDINTAAGAQLFFQNVNTIEGEQNDAYPVPDSTHGHVFKTGDATYGSLRFYTLTTASVRISANENERGIRFSTAVNKKDFDALNVKADFGTLITPNDYLAAANNDFTALAEDNYLDVNSTATGADNFLTLRGADNDTYYYFCGSITGIKAANYDWDYSAIGYVTINGDTVYSANYTTRNAAYVANAAISDPDGGYSETELDILRGYLPQN